MRGTEPKIRATILEGLDELLKSHAGLNIGLVELLEEAGVGAPPHGAPLQELAFRSFARVLELAANRTRDDCFGLHFAATYPIGAMGILGYLVNNAPDPQTMMDCLSRYARLQTDGIGLDCRIEGRVADIAFRFSPAVQEPRKQVTEFTMALVVNRARRLAGDDWQPQAAEFDYREPNCGGEYESLFGRSLKFDAPIARITASVASLNRKSQGSNSKLFGMLREIAEKELRSINTSGELLNRIGAFIVERLAVGRADLEQAAQAVNLTPRQLQSELKRRGTNFEEQVGDVRRRLAQRYLQDTNLPMTEIAMMLGFSELSAFTRAAQRWFAKSPTEIRAEFRAGGID